MHEDFLQALKRCETDVDGALHRMSDNEELYLSCLKAFLEDDTMEELEHALNVFDWDRAFTATHALKGVAGNMGFVPLFYAAAELVVLIRAGRVTEVEPSYMELRRCYREITSAISEHTKS